MSKFYSIIICFLFIINSFSQIKKSDNQQHITHIVSDKETIYSIRKMYNISEEDLKNANPILKKEVLKINQELIIPIKKTASGNTNSSKIIYHEVLPKETKYSISRQYNITIENLEKLNPSVSSSLPVGTILIIKTDMTDDHKIEYNKLARIKTKSNDTFQETKKELFSLNTDNRQWKKEYKKVVILLPFNLQNQESDDAQAISYTKNNKFLNLTLDFYSGVLIAIDSVKALGIPFNIEIYDSKETKNSSDIRNIFRTHDLDNADAVIGPFYQKNVEEMAQLLSKANVPVISPLSKEKGVGFPNLYQTIPRNTVLRNAVFDYLKKQNGNIVAVVDKKRGSTLRDFEESGLQILMAELNESSELISKKFVELLSPNEKNFVILDTKNTKTILSTLSIMKSKSSDYDLQLVILESNDALYGDNINFEDLVTLKLLYPSISKENILEPTLIFEKKYKSINNTLPSYYATRGFDVTFDTLMRLSQGNTFNEMAQSFFTEQVENKFDYYPSEDEGFVNNGVYLLSCDIDFTAKEVR